METHRIPKPCFMIPEVNSLSITSGEPVYTDRLRVWMDIAKQDGFEIVLHKGHIEIRGLGFGPILVQPGAANVVVIKRGEL